MLLALLVSTILMSVALLELGLSRSLGSATALSMASAASAVQRPRGATSDDLTAEHRALETAQLVASGESHLKALYFDCARETSTQRIDTDEAVFCQAVADALLHRHFGGSLDRLLGWWQDQPTNAHPIASIDSL